MGTAVQTRVSVAVLLAGSAFALPAAQAAEFATVVAATPVTAPVPVSRQRCGDSQQLVQPAPSGAGSLLGAIAGGVIGHSVGGGFGRAAATGFGVVAGSLIGNQVEANATPPVEVPVRRCRTESGVEDRIVGYDVMYDYAGQRYSTRMTRDPGTRLAVSIQPALPDGASAPAPAYDDPPPQASAPPAVYDDDEPAPRALYAEPSYYAQYPYYAPYYAGPSIYIAPVLGFGFGYYGGHIGGRFGGHHGGHRGGHRGGHHRR